MLFRWKKKPSFNSQARLITTRQWSNVGLTLISPKALFDALFKRFIYHFNILLWPDPLCKALFLNDPFTCMSQA